MSNNGVSKKVLKIPALGRRFFIGSRYDARNDVITPGRGRNFII